MPWGNIWFLGRDARKNFRDGSFDWKLKVLVQFFRVKRDWSATSPPPRPFFPPSPSDKIFIIAISLKIVQRSDKKNFRVDVNPPGPGGRRYE